MNTPEIDNLLSTLRKEWMAAKELDKGKYMEQINTLLEERLKLMSARDKSTP
jgi:hypothetical protein